MKKIVFLSLLLLLAVGLTGCGLKTADNASTGGPLLRSEKDNYVKASAALSCYMFSGDEANPATLGDPAYNQVLAPYGFTIDQMEGLGEKYGNDSSLPDKLMKEMQKQCPDLIEAFSQVGN